jgi:hypothetical protein
MSADHQTAREVVEVRLQNIATLLAELRELTAMTPPGYWKDLHESLRSVEAWAAKWWLCEGVVMGRPQRRGRPNPSPSGKPERAPAVPTFGSTSN